MSGFAANSTPQSQGPFLSVRATAHWLRHPCYAVERSVATWSCEPPRFGGRQAGFTRLEAIVATCLGLLALAGILYLFKGTPKSVPAPRGVPEKRMRGQFTLSEAQFHLSRAGLGLPSEFRNLSVENGDLVIRMNPSQRSAPASMDPASNRSVTVYRISRADTALFSGRAYVAALARGGVAEVSILAVLPRPGSPGEALVRLAGGKAKFTAATTLFPVERVRLHRCTGIGPDSVGGDFQVLDDNPGLRLGLDQDTLTLAEGIESIGYRYILSNGAAVDGVPAGLDSLRYVDVTVVAQSAAAEGTRQDTLKARVEYRRSL